MSEKATATETNLGEQEVIKEHGAMMLGCLLEAEGCQQVRVSKTITLSSEQGASFSRNTMTNGHKLGTLQENEPPSPS